jgi:hypothetical protein
MTASTSTTCLKDSDVVCGRGGLANKHPGNRMFRRLVAQNKSIYQSSMNPSHKQLLVMSIIMAIQQHGGRFVKRAPKSSTCNNAWLEISEKESKHKTAQALREIDSSSDHSSSSSSSSSAASSRSSSPVPIFKLQSSSTKSSLIENDDDNSSTVMKSAATTTTTTTPDMNMIRPKLCKSTSDVIPPEPLSLAEADSTIMMAEVDGGLAEFLMGFLPQQENNVIATTSQYQSPAASADFDLIPLDDADDLAFENYSEFQDLCNGLVDVLSCEI